MNGTTVGIDLAKSVFAVCEGDSRGHGGRSSVLKHGEFLKWLQMLPTGTVIAMEEYSAAHSWERTMRALGLEPRLIAAEFVRPFRKNQRVKNDSRDAEAVLTALHAPGMRFVTIKTEEQQQRLAWHRLRKGWKAERSARRQSGEEQSQPKESAWQIATRWSRRWLRSAKRRAYSSFRSLPWSGRAGER